MAKESKSRPPLDVDQYAADLVDYVEGTGQWPQFLRYMEKNCEYSEAEVESANAELRKRAGRA